MKKGRPRKPEAFKLNILIEKNLFMKFRAKAGNYKMSETINLLINDWLKSR